MDLSKPRSDIEEALKSPCVAQTSELRSPEDPAENKAEQPSEKDAISSEKTCDEGELSSVPTEDEQTRNITPDTSVEASEKSNEDKQDLSADVEQQESTSISNEDDLSQSGNSAKPLSDVEEAPKSPSVAQTTELRSSEDPMENKVEQSSEKDAISSEKTWDVGELSSVPIEDEQTSNVTPDASVETSDKSNEDKQDLSTDVEQQESASISNEDDLSQTGNGAKPISDIEEAPKSSQTTELGSSEDPMENKAEQPSEKDAISSENTCDEGELSSVPIEDEQTRNVTPDASVETSDKSNEDKQDLSTDVEQQESTSISNEDDLSQSGNGAKPISDIEEAPKSPSVALTTELRSSEDPMENKVEQSSEKDAISSEKTWDVGELSSVPIEDEQTSNVTPDASVETSDKSNEDKQDLSTDVEQQESTSISNEDDLSQSGNSAKRLAKSLTGDKEENSVTDAIQGNSTDISCENVRETSSQTSKEQSRPENVTPEKVAEKLTKFSTGNKQRDSVKDAVQDISVDISHENVGQTLSQTTEKQDQPENVTPNKSAAAQILQILEQIQTGKKQVNPVQGAIQQISAKVSPKDGEAGQALCEIAEEEQAPPGNGTSEKSAEMIKRMLARDKQNPKVVLKDIRDMVGISIHRGVKLGVNNVEKGSTDAQKASSQRDEGQGNGSQLPQKTSQQVATGASAENFQIAVNKNNLKSVDLSLIQTVIAGPEQKKYSMVHKTSAMGSPIYESVDTKEQYYWVSQSSLPIETLSRLSEGHLLGRHYALVPLITPQKLIRFREDELRRQRRELGLVRERYCSVPDCKSRSNAFPDLQFFRFPKNEPWYVCLK